MKNNTKTTNNTSLAGVPVTSKFLQWLAEQEQFAKNYLKAKYDCLSFADVEDVFANYCASCCENNARTFESWKLTTLSSRLSYAAVDFIRKKKAIKNGGEAGLTSYEEMVENGKEASVLTNTNTISAKNGSEELRFSLKLVRSIKKSSKGRKLILLNVLERWLLEGNCEQGLADIFTETEAKAFFHTSAETGSFDRQVFKNKVNKRYHDVVRELSKVALQLCQHDKFSS